jgi:hypothetical protein
METTCPRCQNRNPDTAQFCAHCGAPLSQTPPPRPGGGTDKSTLALILGILSIVACGPIAGIPGIFIAKSEIDAIRQGQSDPANMGKAKWGLYLSIAGCVLTVVCICIYISIYGMSFLTMMM